MIYQSSYHKQSGFTLIELMIVIAIIWLLAASLYPSLTNYIARSKTVAVQSSVRSLLTMVKANKIDVDRFTNPVELGHNLYGGCLLKKSDSTIEQAFRTQTNCSADYMAYPEHSLLTSMKPDILKLRQNVGNDITIGTKTFNLWFIQRPDSHPGWFPPSYRIPASFAIIVSLADGSLYCRDVLGNETLYKSWSTAWRYNGTLVDIDQEPYKSYVDYHAGSYWWTDKSTYIPYLLFAYDPTWGESCIHDSPIYTQYYTAHPNPLIWQDYFVNGKDYY